MNQHFQQQSFKQITQNKMKTLFDTPLSQYDRILSLLKSGHTLTPLEALDKFGCLRLGARIYEMKLNGIEVKREMIKVGKKKRVARYSL